MSKTLYFKEGNRLFTQYEAKVMCLPIQKMKKVYRSIDEITETHWFGRIDATPAELISEISSKQLRNRKINKQMTALGLI